jgi:alkylglycerol monooxygenase
LIATPSFLLLVFLEKAYGYFAKKDIPRFFDLIGSLSSGITNSVKDVLQLSLTIMSYQWLVGHVSIFTIENKPATYIIAFLALDLSGYWVHRISHSVNFFWNKHAIHHSSEEFDLACALRQSISSFIGIFTIFLLPAAVLGVPNAVIAVVGPIHFFSQFWYHTVYIKKMGFLEHILVTPSHHRVHHAINKEYMDKNMAQIFIFWDKIFGTFQEELESAPPVYGISRPPTTWNPIKINFQHMFLMIKDAWRAPAFIDKLTIWFKPTGWRPAGFEEKYPVAKITDPYAYQKYRTKIDLTSKIWIFAQFMFTAYAMMMLYGHIADLNIFQMLGVGVFIYLNVYTYSEFMDGEENWHFMEIAKNLIFISILSTNYIDGLFSDSMPLKVMTAGMLVVFSIFSVFIKDSRKDAKAVFQSI